MSKKSKHQLSFTIPITYLDALDSLVEQGIYLNRDEAIRDAIRIFFRKEGIEPFSPKAEEPGKKVSKK